MRKRNWPSLLHEYLEGCRTKAFAWGIHDCCLMACNWIQLVTDVDPAEDFRDKYNDIRSALTVIGEYGDLEKLASAMAEKYGFKEVPVNFAQTGDIVVVCDSNLDTNMGKGHPTLGIMSNDGRPVIPVAVGLISVLRESATRAFRI